MDSTIKETPVRLVNRPSNAAVFRPLVSAFALAVALSGGACSDDAATGGDDVDASPTGNTDGAPNGDGNPNDPDAMNMPDAPPVFVGDPADPGAYDVHIEDDVTVPIEMDEAVLTVCSPSSDGGASPAAGPFPALVVSPGFQLPRNQYQSMCDHMASWGYVVLLQDYARDGGIFNPPNHQTLAEDIGRLLDWALSAQSGIADRIDEARIAVAGHSLGGKVSILSATLDSRVKAVVGWDPVDANPPINNGSPSVTPELMDGLTVPLAVLGELLDSQGGFMQCAPADNNYQQYFENACSASEALEVTVEEADHMDWIDDRSTCGLTCNACQTGVRDDAETRAITRRVTTAFLEANLRGRDDLRTYLTEPDVGTGATVRAQVPGC